MLQWYAFISIFIIINKVYATVGRVYINTMKLLFVCILCVFNLFESLVQIKIEIESRLHCIDLYEDDCMLNCF